MFSAIVLATALGQSLSIKNTWDIQDQSDVDNAEFQCNIQKNNMFNTECYKEYDSSTEIRLVDINSGKELIIDKK